MDNMPLEIERKYLIEYPDMDILESISSYNKTYIEQTYLKTEEISGGLRVRKRGNGDNFEYTKTYKRDINKVKRIEIEDKISEDEYNQLLKDADPLNKTIRKYRHCFVYKGKLFELDTYPFWTDRATLEIELETEEEYFEIPKFIKIIKEVTDDLRYRNRSLSREIVNEDI